MTRGSESYARISPRPFSSTFRWARLSSRRRKRPHCRPLSARSMLWCLPRSLPLLYPHGHHMCVTAKGLACVQRLSHAARHGPFTSASMLRRTFFGMLTLKPGSTQSALIFFYELLPCECVATCVFRSVVGRLLFWTWISRGQRESGSSKHGSFEFRLNCGADNFLQQFAHFGCDSCSWGPTGITSFQRCWTSGSC